MYRVEVRFLGDTTWRTGAPPLTLQAAFGQARVLSNSRVADQARVVPTAPAVRAADLKV